jgi:hypothetical protein
MIVTMQAASKSQVASIVVDAWKYGIEVEVLHDNQIELTSAQDTRMEGLIKRFPSAKILHTELVKEI